MLLPVATEFDVDSNTLYAETDELGTYCVLDMEVVMRNFGIEPEGMSTEVVTQQMYSAANLENNEKPKGDEYCVNFIIDVRKDALTLGQISSIKKALLEFVYKVFNSKITLRLITQEASSFSDKDYNVEENFMSFDSFEKALNDITFSNKEGIFGNYCTITDSISVIVDSSDMNVNNFIFIIYAQKDAIFEQNIADELCQKAENNGINISIVSPSETVLSGFQSQLAKDTGGLTINDLNNFNFEVIYNHVYGKPLDDQEFNAVLITGYQPVKLNGRLNPFNGIDTDKDSLSDWEEIDVEHWIEQGLITYDNNGEIKLPTLGKCIGFSEKSYVKEGFDRIPWYYVEQLWNKSVLPICSDPTHKDTDRDGYDDEQDLDRLTPFVNPIILVHGRTDSSVGAFGLHTDVCPYGEDSKNSNINFSEDKSDYYSDVETHIIEPKDIDFNKLGFYLSQHNYEINKNLFAFNYPNWDFAQNNAPKLAGYIENMKSCAKKNTYPTEGFLATKSDIFATRNDLENNNARFILIGHSNGGLVSRYYIENMGGDKDVDKLITIDTPHYGSNLAYPSTIAMLSGHTLGMAVPLDVELRPNSSLFTGQKVDTNSNGVFKFVMGSKAKERLKYIQENQSPKLNGNSCVDTQYYAIGGAIAYYKGSPFADMVYNAEFALNSSSLDAFKDGVNDAIKDKYSTEVERIPPLSGDNVVELYSQFGLKVDGNSITEHIEFKKATIFMTFKPFYKQYTPINHFHGDILNNRQMQSTVLKYIGDQGGI